MIWLSVELPLLATGGTLYPLAAGAWAGLFGWLGYRRARARNRGAVKWAFFCVFFGWVAYGILFFISRHDLDQVQPAQSPYRGSRIEVGSRAGDAPEAATGATFHELRSKVLSLSSGEIGVAPTPEHPRVWGALMETGYARAIASLVALGDGTVSLYFSNDGGVIGAGGNEAVRDAAARFIESAERRLEAFAPTDVYPLPTVGQVRFYLSTFSGHVTARANEDELVAQTSDLAELFNAGQAVITAMRESGILKY